MCLAVPGKLLSVTDAQPLLRTGKVSFGGVLREVNMALVPEATIGDYLLVHAGIAIGIIDEKEAERVFDYLEESARSDDSEERLS
jgi:hydrogenase expression/formation protein HypC